MQNNNNLFIKLPSSFLRKEEEMQRNVPGTQGPCMVPCVSSLSAEQRVSAPQVLLHLPACRLGDSTIVKLVCLQLRWDSSLLASLGDMLLRLLLEFKGIGLMSIKQ